MKKKLLISILFLIGCAPRHNYYIKTVVAPKNTVTNIAVIPENWDTYWISSFAYRSLITELMDVGYNQVLWDAGNRSSGIYFVKLHAGSFNKTSKLVLIK